MFAGRFAPPGAGALDVALAVKAGTRSPVLVGLELWLDGLATLFTDGYEAAVPILRRANSGFDTGDMPASEQVRWKWLATVLSIHMWDDVRWQAISEAHVQIAREAGGRGEGSPPFRPRAPPPLLPRGAAPPAAPAPVIPAGGEGTQSQPTPLR